MHLTIYFKLFLLSFAGIMQGILVQGQQAQSTFGLNTCLQIDTLNGTFLGSIGSGQSVEFTDPSVLQHFTESKYLIIQCEQRSSTSGIVILDFFKQDEKSPSLQAKIGLLPKLRTYLVFPSSYLDGQQIFLPRFPRQLKGVVFGSRLSPEDLARIHIYSSENAEKGEGILYYQAYFSDKLPDFNILSPSLVVDNYGQWKQSDWKNKITEDKEWNKHSEELKKLSTEISNYSKEFSKYGGWRGLQFDATGFFRTHHDGKRWWFVDPEGYAFLSFGMDCVRPDEPAILSGNESLFEYLPPEDSEFKSVYGTSRGMKTIDFFRVNMIRIFGPEWYDAWVKMTVNKLVTANFNTVGNWSLERFSTKSGLPYVIPLNNFPSTKIFLYRDFPDVFSPEYREKAKVFASQLDLYKDDPNLIGYFLRNEPQWAFGNNNLAFEMLASESPSYTRTALIIWLKGKYQVVDSLSKSWNLDITEFEDIRSIRLKEYPSDSCRSDLWEFSKLMVSEYVDVISEETRKVDPNHLNLGMRYAYISSDLLYTAGEAFDVFSINGYNSPGPPDTDEIYKRSGKPVMIGEFHFGATDRGLPSTGLKGVKNQKERGKAYRYYLEQGFARPEIIGIHYFQWMDQSVMGRFDGENYNIGFNDILYQPYEELVKQAKKAHINAYPVAKGIRKPFGRRAVEVPVIAF